MLLENLSLRKQMILGVFTRGFSCLWSIHIVLIMFCLQFFLVNVLSFCVGFVIGLNV